MNNETSITYTTCCVCGANISGEDKKCPFCGASNNTNTNKQTTQKEKTFFRRRKRNVEPDGTPFFNPSVSIKERVMAMLSYLMPLFIIPVLYYKKQPAKKTEFITFHINQGIASGILFTICICIAKVCEKFLLSMNVSLFNLLYTIAVLCEYYVIVIFMLSVVCILRGNTKEFPIINKITLFK